MSVVVVLRVFRPPKRRRTRIYIRKYNTYIGCVVHAYITDFRVYLSMIIIYYIVLYTHIIAYDRVLNTSRIDARILLYDESDIIWIILLWEHWEPILWHTLRWCRWRACGRSHKMPINNTPWSTENLLTLLTICIPTHTQIVATKSRTRKKFIHFYFQV